MKLQELKIEAMSFDRAEIKKVYLEGRQTAEDGHVAIYNVDKGKLASFVSTNYQLIQHRDMTEELIEALTGLNLPCEAKVLRINNKLVIDIDFPTKTIKPNIVGEEFTTGVRIINSYDKSTGIMILPKLTRLACSNGMVVHRFIAGHQVSHVSKLAQDFRTGIDVALKNMINSDQKLKAIINGCMEDSVENELMAKIIAKMCENTKKHITEIESRLKGNTRWDLYNAFTNYATHGAQIKPSVEEWLQNQAQKVLVKPLVELQPIEVDK